MSDYGKENFTLPQDLKPPVSAPADPLIITQPGEPQHDNVKEAYNDLVKALDGSQKVSDQNDAMQINEDEDKGAKDTTDDIQADEEESNELRDEDMQPLEINPLRTKKSKKYNKKKILAIICAAALAAGGAYLYTDFVATRTIFKMQMTQVEEDKIVNDVLSYMSESHTSDEIEQVMLKALKLLPAARCTSLVDTYLYAVYNTAAQYTLDDDQTNKLYAAMNKDGTINMDLVDDETLKTQISDLEEQHVVLKYLNGALFWDADYAYFDQTFGQYVNPDYRAMIHFYAEEKKNSYSDEDGERMYDQIVTKRLDTLFTMMATYPDSEIYDIMKESYYFYKAVYLGAYAQDYIFDSGSIRPEVLESYKAYVQTCQDSELKKFIQKLIDDYTESNGIRTVPIYESIKEFCGFYEENKKE